jgi:O-antigen/teichoic acid export membrane protein
VYKGVLRTLTALFWGTGQEFAFQILSAILWIRFWGVDLYSEWLLISLFPVLVMRGNTGLYHGATSRLIGEFHERDFVAAGLTYGALHAAQSIFLLAIALLYGLSSWLLDATTALHFFSTIDLAIVAVLFFVQFALFQWQQAVLSLVKADGLAPSAIMWQNHFRLGYVLILLAGAAFAEPVTCLAAAVAVQAVVTAVTAGRFAAVRSKVVAARVGTLHEKTTYLLRKGVQFSLFPFGQTALHTISVWTLGFFFGPPAGAAFHNMRTISRSAVLLSRAGELAVRLELSALFARRAHEEARELTGRAIAYTSAFCGLAMVALVLLGRPVFLFLTDGQLGFAQTTYFILCAGSLIHSVSQIYLAVPFSLNEQDAIATRYLLTMTCALALCLPAAKAGMPYVALIVLGTEVVVLYFARATSLQLLGDRR